MLMEERIWKILKPIVMLIPSLISLLDYIINLAAAISSSGTPHAPSLFNLIILLVPLWSAYFILIIEGRQHKKRAKP